MTLSFYLGSSQSLFRAALEMSGRVLLAGHIGLPTAFLYGSDNVLLANGVALVPDASYNFISHRRATISRHTRKIYTKKNRQQHARIWQEYGKSTSRIRRS